MAPARPAIHHSTWEAPKPAVVGLMEQAETAFLRDQAQLLKEHGQEWVAYHGGQQLGTAAARDELYRECIRRGISPDELVVWSIEAVVEDMSLGEQELSMR